MGVKKFTHKVENHFKCHGVNVSLKLISTLKEYGSLTYEIKIMPGTKTDAIFVCASDIKAALQIPVFQPFRDNGKIYLKVSKKNITKNSLFEMLVSREFNDSENVLPIALGYDMMGRMVFSDLARMPHIMYAGSTNSGKSVGLRCLILSLIVKQSVRRVNLIIYDTGANGMREFEGIPHLSYSVVHDVRTGIYVIGKLIEEMERRKKLERSDLRIQPAIVCIIDEFTSFINHADNKKQSNELVCAISELLRRGRHVKIHMVLAAQDPTKDNLKKVDTTNITVRVAFQCAKYQNSITILGTGGAEKLTGNGTALYLSNEYSYPKQLQGAYISLEMAGKLINCIKSREQDFDNKFIIPELETLEELDSSLIKDSGSKLNKEREKLANIIMWTLGKVKVSAEQIKKMFSMNKEAYNIINLMYEKGIISEKNSNQPRSVLPHSIEDLSDELLDFLTSCGFSRDSISQAIDSREGKDKEIF